MAQDSTREPATRDPRTLADLINYLFGAVGPDSDQEYTGKDVVAGVNALGIALSPAHLSELRRGIKRNPTIRVLEGLAEFFGCPVAFLLGDPHAIARFEAEVELRHAMRDAEVHALAHRVARLNPQQRVALHRLLAQILTDTRPEPAHTDTEPRPDAAHRAPG